MVIVIILAILLCIGIGGYLGFKVGCFYITKENDTLRSQLMLQERFSRTWAAEATDKYALSQQVASQQTQNLGSFMNMVAHTLSAYQQQHAGSQPPQQNEKIADLIAKAKSIGTLHE